MRSEIFNEVSDLINSIGIEKARQACLKIKGWEIVDREKYQEKRPIFDDGPIRKILSSHGLTPTKERITAFIILSCVRRGGPNENF
jgi:hypothetical protein